VGRPPEHSFFSSTSPIQSAIPIHRTGRCRPDAAHPYLGQAHYCVGFALSGFRFSVRFFCQDFLSGFRFLTGFSSFILSKYIIFLENFQISQIVQI
jgi:hypothetical protein